MIPCIGCAFYNRRDLLQRLISSIDHEVGWFFTANNGQQSLHELQFPSFVQGVGEEVNERNLGCAGGWNQCLDFAFNQKGLDSVFIVGNDIEFHPGDLVRMEKAVIDFPEADFIFGNHSFSNFLVKRSGFDKFGWFDENFYPAYWEDGDAWMRMKRNKTIKTIHATGLHTKHEGSATVNSDSALRNLNQITFQKNREYYESKWDFERAEHPFNNPNNPVNFWQISSDRMAQPHFRTGS